MFDVFFKKKITEKKLVDFFVISTIKMVDTAFEDVAQLIVNDPEFKTRPVLSSENSDPFLWVVITGNMQLISKYFNDYQDIRMIEDAYRNFSNALGLPIDVFKSEIKKNDQLFNRLNSPSKNTVYAMSKAVFHKYSLAQYQDDYFKNMDAPNPIFLKRLNEIMEQFLFNWQQFIDDYKIVE